MRPGVEVAPVPNDLADLGHFSDPSLLILASLAGGDKHGYAMIEDIERMASVRLGPGTLYGALARLEQRGLIAPLAATGRILRALHQPRRSAVTVFCAYIAFVIAGLAYNQMIEDDLPALDTSHPAIAAAYHVILYGSAVALLAVLAGGLPIALAVARRALVARRQDILLLFAVPPLPPPPAC